MATAWSSADRFLAMCRKTTSAARPYNLKEAVSHEDHPLGDSRSVRP